MSYVELQTLLVPQWWLAPGEHQTGRQTLCVSTMGSYPNLRLSRARTCTSTIMYHPGDFSVPVVYSCHMRNPVAGARDGNVNVALESVHQKRIDFQDFTKKGSYRRIVVSSYRHIVVSSSYRSHAASVTGPFSISGAFPGEFVLARASPENCPVKTW